MGNGISIAAAALLCLAAAGCRREDWRETVVAIPDLAESGKAAITQAVSVYEGVDKRSLEWDFAAKTLKVRFDSMKIAKTNIRMAIERAGFKVVHPEKNGAPAGYIDARDKAIPSQR